MPDDDERDPWVVESDLIAFNRDDFEVADCAEWRCNDARGEGFRNVHDLPPEDHDEFREWVDVLLDDTCAVLALEQSCHEGVLLPWDMRAVRLATVPRDALQRLHLMWDAISAELRFALAFYVYWLTRAERARRTGKPDWSPRAPMPPAEQEHAFFRPSKLLFRQQL